MAARTGIPREISLQLETLEHALAACDAACDSYMSKDESPPSTSSRDGDGCFAPLENGQRYLDAARLVLVLSHVVLRSEGKQAPARLEKERRRLADYQTKVDKARKRYEARMERKRKELTLGIADASKFVAAVKKQSARKEPVSVGAEEVHGKGKQRRTSSKPGERHKSMAWIDDLKTPT